MAAGGAFVLLDDVSGHVLDVVVGALAAVALDRHLAVAAHAAQPVRDHRHQVVGCERVFGVAQVLDRVERGPDPALQRGPVAAGAVLVVDLLALGGVPGKVGATLARLLAGTGAGFRAGPGRRRRRRGG